MPISKASSALERIELEHDLGKVLKTAKWRALTKDKVFITVLTNKVSSAVAQLVLTQGKAFVTMPISKASSALERIELENDLGKVLKTAKWRGSSAG